jgi:hypothetical protein
MRFSLVYRQDVSDRNEIDMIETSAKIRIVLRLRISREKFKRKLNG